MNLNANIWVTMHSDGTKLEGIQSISTSVLVNPICQHRRGICGGICEKCYANALCQMRHSLDNHLVDNMEILSTRLLTKAEASAVPITTLYARIESFGDVRNVIQARNYIRIIRTHKLSRFGIWSKNWYIWYAAFLKEGKPRNCTFVLSSMFLNVRMEVPERMKPYVDHVFTVWTKDKYEALWRGGNTACAGIRCLSCLKCYTKTGKKVPFYIDELKR